jgi:hypothetical protein
MLGGSPFNASFAFAVLIYDPAGGPNKLDAADPR